MKTEEANMINQFQIESDLRRGRRLAEEGDKPLELMKGPMSGGSRTEEGGGGWTSAKTMLFLFLMKHIVSSHKAQIEFLFFLSRVGEMK